METAGIPSDSGMLASVEEQSRRLRMPRNASTARRQFRIGAPSRNSPPGREPISLRRAVTRPPVARLFSASEACATQAARSDAISSIRSGFSDRKSTLARASVGMQLMLVPPWIRPKLKEDRGTGSSGAPDVEDDVNSAEVN